MNAARGVGAGRARRSPSSWSPCCSSGGDGGTTYKLRFQNAGQLVKDDDVQVGGRRIGSVRKIELTDDNQAEITITVAGALRAAARGHDGDHPRHLAVGHRQPLHRAHAGPELATASSPTGRRWRTDKTTSIVDLDQLFNTLDPKTRKALQEVIQGSATWYDGTRRRRPTRRRSTSTRR